MSTTYGINVLGEDKPVEVAFVHGIGEGRLVVSVKNPLLVILPWNTPVIPLDNEPQGVLNVGDLMKIIGVSPDGHEVMSQSSRAHANGVEGCKRHKKDLMLSFMTDQRQIYDVFLDREDAVRFYKEIGQRMKQNLLGDVEIIHSQHREITGWDTPQEEFAYDKGRSDEQSVLTEWIKSWTGTTNSGLGQILFEKFLGLRKKEEN